MFIILQVESHMWEADDEDPPIGHIPATPLFPDALPSSPSPHQLTVLSTAAETTPNLMSVGEDRGFMQLQATEQRQVSPLFGNSDKTIILSLCHLADKMFFLGVTPHSRQVAEREQRGWHVHASLQSRWRCLGVSNPWTWRSV